MNNKKAVLISTGVLGVLSAGALSLIGNYFYNLALNPKSSKEVIFGTPEEASSTSGEVVNETIQWLLNISNYSAKEAFVLSNYNVSVVGKITYYPIYMLMFIINDNIKMPKIELDDLSKL